MPDFGMGFDQQLPGFWDGGEADPSQGTNVVMPDGTTKWFPAGQVPYSFLGGDPAVAAQGSQEYNDLRDDARTRNLQGIAKIATLVGGGAALNGLGAGGTTGGLQGSATVSGTNTAAGSVAGAGGSGINAAALNAAPGAFGGGGSIGAGLGIPGMSTGVTVGAGAGGSAGLFGGLGGAGAAATPGIIGGAGGAGANAGGTLANAAAGSGGNWWQNILGQFGGGADAGLGSNIFAGLSGAAGLSSLFGGNDLSDMFGLSGNDAGAFRGVNTAGPGGAGTNYNPDTNTMTSTGGNLDPIQGQLAGYAGNQITQAGQNSQGDILGLMRQQAQPFEQKAFNGINNNMFARGRLGANDSATGEAYAGFSRGLAEADTGRQLAAYGLSDQLQNSAYTRGVGAAGASQALQFGAQRPGLLSLTPNDTRGQASPQLDFWNQLLQGFGG